MTRATEQEAGATARQHHHCITQALYLRRSEIRQQIAKGEVDLGITRDPKTYAHINSMLVDLREILADYDRAYEDMRRVL